jgi:hypothetical protein
MGPANETYIEQLIHELVALDPYAPWSCSSGYSGEAQK